MITAELKEGSFEELQAISPKLAVWVERVLREGDPDIPIYKLWLDGVMGAFKKILHSSLGDSDIKIETKKMIMFRAKNRYNSTPLYQILEQPRHRQRDYLVKGIRIYGMVLKLITARYRN